MIASTLALPIRPTVSSPVLWLSAERKRAVPDSIRRQVLARDENTCVGCGHTSLKYMNIHHVGDSEDDALGNLRTLCPACHAVLHFGRSLQFKKIEIWKSPISQ